jgi:hypothetical protein
MIISDHWLRKPDKERLIKGAKMHRGLMLRMLEEGIDKKGTSILTYTEKVRLLNLAFADEKDSGIYITQSGRGQYEFVYKGVLFDDINKSAGSINIQ